MASPKWLIDKLAYLRKSRQDDPDETVEEVLAKHEAMLQEYCEREFGGRIPEENIYREVVSGESIASRTEVQKVLARIEDPAITGVVVIEPSRLSRGDLTDCGKLITALRYSKTLVHTPMMTYNLENKMERKFFQDELLRGNDFLEYTKDILARGRLAAVKRGCYISSIPPYGYKKIKIGKDPTLEILEPEADAVRLAFRLYAYEGWTMTEIARELNTRGVKPMKGEKWTKPSIRGMLKNAHYIGKVVYNKSKRTSVMEYGEVRKRKLQQENDIVVAEGKHKAIIDRETWEKTREVELQNREGMPSTKLDYTLTNPLGGLIWCKRCGLALRKKKYDQADDRLGCITRGCAKSAKMHEVIDAVIFALENSELPELEMKLKNGDGEARKIQERMLAKLEKQMEGLREQEATQYELLETRVYTPDVFAARNAELREKIEACQSAIFKSRSALPAGVDYAERITALKNAIAALRDPEMPVVLKNKALRAIVARIDYSLPEGEHRKRGVTPFILEISLRM